MRTLSAMFGECSRRSLVRQVASEYVAGMSSDLRVVIVAETPGDDRHDVHAERGGFAAVTRQRMESMSPDSWDRVAQKRIEKDRHRLVPVEVIEQGQALPSNLRVRMRPRPEAEERQVDLSRCPQLGELSRRRRREAEHLPLDPLPQPLVHEARR